MTQTLREGAATLMRAVSVADASRRLSEKRGLARGEPVCVHPQCGLA